MQFITQGYPAYAYTGGRPFEAALPTIVFIHGAGCDHSVWQWQSRYFAHHGHSVLAVDLPGHGRSPGSARATIGEYAEWVAGMLDAIGLPQAALVGHSMGSLVALETALRHTPRVAKLALVATSAPMPVSDAFLAAARDEPPVGHEMASVWGHVRGVQLLSSAIPGASLLSASRRLTSRSKSLHADLEACNGYRADAEKLKALSVPTLVVAGKRDQMTHLKAGKAMAETIPGAKLVALDAGHALMGEAPKELLAALRDFLK